MSAALARSDQTLGTTMGQVGPWPTFLPGFDPFQYLRASCGFEYGVTRTEDGYEVEVPVPGYTSDEIEVSLKDCVLTASGKNDRWGFSRSLMIPDDVDTESVDVKIENGMLRVGLKRHPRGQRRKIHVR
jgi:HSP20 family molecular chaperone IbpA